MVMMMSLSFIGKKFNLSCTERCHCCSEPVLTKVRWLSCRWWSAIVHSSALVKLCFRTADSFSWFSLLLRILWLLILWMHISALHILSPVCMRSRLHAVLLRRWHTHYVLWIPLWLRCHCGGIMWYELHWNLCNRFFIFSTNPNVRDQRQLLLIWVHLSLSLERERTSAFCNHFAAGGHIISLSLKFVQRDWMHVFLQTE